MKLACCLQFSSVRCVYSVYMLVSSGNQLNQGSDGFCVYVYV